MAALNLSIVTGDSNILSGKRDAETTTSCANAETASKVTAIFSEADDTCTSLSAYPIEVMSKVAGYFMFPVNLKFPLSSVKVPMFDPFTTIVTAETFSLLLLFTLPVMVVEVCVLAEKAIIIIHTKHPIIFFIKQV